MLISPEDRKLIQRRTRLIRRWATILSVALVPFATLLFSLGAFGSGPDHLLNLTIFLCSGWLIALVVGMGAAWANRG